MTGETPPPTPVSDASPVFATPPRRHGRLLLIVGLVAFLCGIAAMYALLPKIQAWRTPATTTVQPAEETQPSARQTPQSVTAAAPVTLDGMAARTAMLDAQLRQVEERMAGVDTASRTAAGYARRAEGLMIAFAARRALDRGLQLGYVEGQLRDRFSAEQPQAVATVIAASKDPLTLADLREGLSRLAPTLTSGPSNEGMLASAWREITNLVVLRRESTPSPRPDDRLTRARLVLDGGNVEAAMAEVARMPGAADATSWIDAAKRYIEARRAISTLELAAISGQAGPGAPTAPAPAPAAPTTNPAGELPGA